MEHIHETTENYENTTDKYNEALNLYPTTPDEIEIKKFVEKISAESKGEVSNEIKEIITSCLDFTSLRATDNEETILALTERINDIDNNFPTRKNVAAICVFPNFAKIISEALEADNVKIACVAGGFPSSQTFPEIKIAETKMALMDGANEIDTVISVGKFLSEDYEGMCDEIEEIKDVCGKNKLKVIIETNLLKTAENIKKAAILSMYSGADFVKTSTGKDGSQATPEAAYVMCIAIKEYYEKTGIKTGFKAAGGINSIEDAFIYYNIVKNVLGNEWTNRDLFRIGSSKLAEMLFI